MAGMAMQRTPGQIQQSLFALTARGIKYDLDRISAAAQCIDNPQNGCPAFHVAGTNGKGSTCVYIESILRHAGYSTGLFTSPHLVKFEERFRINGTIIETGEWVEVFHHLEQYIAEYHLTFFEATMLMAAELFRRRKVDWAVYETGLGGRLDATNILTPRVAVITRVAMDHREYLGDTLAEVFGEKLGIVKETVPLVIAEPKEPELHRMAEMTTAGRRAPCTFIAADGIKSAELSGGGVSFVHDGTGYTTRLTGNYQVENALLAIAAIKQAQIGVSLKQLQTGIAEASLPGRFQRIAVGNKTVILDVAHNPAAAAELCTTLRSTFPDSPICMVTGIMADKEYGTMLTTYTEVARHIILTKPDTARAASARMLAEHLSPDRYSIVEGVGEAVRSALLRDETVVCVTGSFFTVGEAITGLELDL